jgi:hypothetical protein
MIDLETFCEYRPINSFHTSSLTSVSYLNIIDGIIQALPGPVLGAGVVEEEGVHGDRHHHLK